MTVARVRTRKTALPPRPELKGRDVWFFSAVPWDFSLGGRTRALALQLRALGARVTFVEPANLRTSLQRLRQPADAPSDLRVLGVPPTVSRLTDRLPLLPRAHDRIQRAWLAEQLSRVPPPVAIVSTPRWAPILRGLRFSALFYDCLDDLAVHADPARVRMFEAYERELLERADGSFAVSPALVDVLASRGALNLRLSRNGVDFEQFRTAGEAPAPKGPGRRIGYLGALYEWVDFALLAQVARRLPDYEFHLAGPLRRGIDPGELPHLPNVRMPGFVPYGEVPKLMASFDVALIPFEQGDIARAADPIKIYEYFCFGTPVVSTPVGDLDRMDELVYVASGAEAFTAAIETALKEDSPKRRERRIAWARANDWSERADGVARAILEATGASHV